jgi:heme exporter protein A
MLAARELDCVRGGRHLFANLSFSVPSGTLLRVSGANGAGKTSLLRILCGLMLPSGGDVFWRDVTLRQQRDDYWRGLRYVGHLAGVKDEFSAEENLAFSAALSGVHISSAAACTALDKLGLGKFAHLPVRMLSQGQKRRVALARLALPDPGAVLWVLDEPLAALDTAAMDCVLSLIDARLAAGAVVVMTSHQPFSVSAELRSISIPV